MRVTWPRLHDTILNGSRRDVEALLTPLPADHLASFTDNLRTLLDETRARMQGGTTDAAADRWARLTRIYIAAVLCEQTPAQVAWWLKQYDLAAAFRWQSRKYGCDADGVLGGILAARREPAWQADLAGRLAAALSTTQLQPVLYEMANMLAEAGGTTIPLTDAYLREWLLSSADLAARARLREVAPRILEIPLAGRFLNHHYRSPETLAELTAEGRIDRDEMVDACAARLLRGDTVVNMRGFHRLHEALAPTSSEVSTRLPTYLGIATSGGSGTAKLAQAALRAADADKPLDTTTLAELSTAVLARPEASLATAQLSWIDAAIKRDPAAAPELLSTLTTAFGHPAVAVQQRAVRLAAKHFKPQKTTSKTVFGDDLRDRLREAAANLLDPALAPEALAIFGAAPREPETTAPETPSPPPYQPSPKPVPIDSAEELAEAFAPALARHAVDIAQAERILDAVARFAHRDRTVFAAFAPLAARYRAAPDDPPGRLTCQVSGALELLFRAALDDAPLFPAGALRELEMRHSGPTKAVLLRICELADALGTGRPTPCLLATPTEANGAIDPPAFLERLAAYQACDARPMRCDLEQALLRLPPNPGPAVRAALAEAGLPPLPGGLPDFAGFFVREQDGRFHVTAYRCPMRRAIQLEAHVTGKADLEAGMSAYYALIPRRARNDIYIGEGGNALPPHDWPALLPFHPDVVGSLAATLMLDEAEDIKRTVTLFPQLAETGGVPGDVTHATLAIGMSARTAENRIAAIDALLILASRSLLDPAMLGLHIGQLLRHGMIRHNRIVPALNDAAQGGAQREVVAAVAAAVAELVDVPQTRGLADLLLLAARYPEQTRRHPPIEFPRLAELAALAKPARVAQEAKRLSRALKPSS